MDEKNLKGIIFDIQRYAVHDGPGIRTLIFLKGCPLRCKWCQNPESWKTTKEIVFFGEKCIGCKKCLTACEFNAIQFEENGRINREKCMIPNCSLECVKNCVAQAIQLIGEKRSINEVLNIVKKDTAYYKNSEGGVTISGGEPFYQPEFLEAFLKRCKEEKIHTVIETCGNVKWEYLKKILPLIGLLYYDIKLLNREEHKKYTGVNNDIILSNLKKITESDFKNIVIRVPTVPSINDNMIFFSELSKLMKELNLLQVHILPYHRLAERKYEQLGIDYELKNIPHITDKKIEEFKQFLESKGLTVKIGG
jgi:pyruvate formate lyase activating enzyme